MGLEKHLLTFLIIFISSSPFCTNSLHDDHLLYSNYSFQEEHGIDFRNYPSYFSPNFEGINVFDNSSVIDKIEGQLSDFKKLDRKLKSSVTTINVLNSGAKGDGKTDDTKAFQNAWKKACSSSNDVSLVVPHSKSFLLKPLRFLGPCKSQITMEIAGAIVASNDRSDYNKDKRHWLIFDRVKKLVVKGGGTINGNGKIWWQNSCKINKAKPCTKAPTALTFYKCADLVVKNLKIQNAQQMHLSFQRCKNVEASKLVVNAPEESPNTDGIHVTATQNIRISSCTIGTGDDCISIVNGSKKVRATDITCGPGHGISIGSLGSHNSEDYVSDVVVNKAKLSGTTNGVRIKTWQGGSGSANNIKFQNIEMQDVKNPIIIDQDYCDQDEPCKEQGSAVQVKNIMYHNIKGTSTSDAAINFKCSKSHPCQGIILQNVNLVGADGDKADAICKNVNLQNVGAVSPRCL
ncbi:polygalacturonase [Phtheirospermum japonicum]|uniref:endo-polygalacturonase n=1 Tax=Phtheirospermum japonicum TaxID=374723 RepID=A0A830BJZ0_9LAMI|nr:polygalacturonase [Phtheirospermum japonicum]